MKEERIIKIWAELPHVNTPHVENGSGKDLTEKETKTAIRALQLYVQYLKDVERVKRGGSEKRSSKEERLLQDLQNLPKIKEEK